jgi:cobyrinic acid a,c-diamide synthase
MRIPRLVIGGVQSGVGKTTFACAILAALRQRGLRLAPFKAGPDYIDPTYHTRAAGVPCRNLDTWLLPPRAVRELFVRAAAGADVAVVEGVMGLYDGRGSNDPAGAGEDEGSTAHLAKLLDAPVLLVVDASASSRTAAAVVLGCQRFDPQVRLAGVLLSGIASERHLDLVAGPIARATGLPVLGYLPTRPDFALPERHLGLVPAGEQGVDNEFFERLAAQAEATIDLGGVVRVAHEAPPLAIGGENPSLAWLTSPPAPLRVGAGRWSPTGVHQKGMDEPGHQLQSLFPEEAAPKRVRIALALDDAFHFYYQDGLDLLRAHGAELVPFRPLRDEALPDGTQGIYLGGGFPEVFAAELAANEAMLAAIRRAAEAGMPVYGECGGLMYLGQGITDQQGRRHRMVGLAPCWSVMGQRWVTLGYRIARARRRTLLLPAGETVRGHEFHWSAPAEPPAEATAAYDVASAEGRPLGVEGFVGGPRANVLASYVHLHFGSDPRLAPAFVAACAATGRT